MFTARMHCLAWQLPILPLLLAALTPGLAWSHPAVGPWPLWLAAAPVSAWLAARLRKRLHLLS